MVFQRKKWFHKKTRQTKWLQSFVMFHIRKEIIKITKICPHHYKSTTTPSHKNTTTPPRKHKTQPQKHHHTTTKIQNTKTPSHHKTPQNTTTKTQPPQKHHHTTTKRSTPPQKHKNVISAPRVRLVLKVISLFHLVHWMPSSFRSGVCLLLVWVGFFGFFLACFLFVEDIQFFAFHLFSYNLR